MASAAPVTDGIAAFALNLDLAAVPAPMVRLATRLLADTLGCALAARGEPLAERLAAYARRHGAAAGPRASLLVARGPAGAAAPRRGGRGDLAGWQHGAGAPVVAAAGSARHGDQVGRAGALRPARRGSRRAGRRGRLGAAGRAGDDAAPARPRARDA